MESKVYEAMFMIDPSKAAQDWESIKKQLTDMIVRRGGTVLNSKKWGERKLAYEINGHKRAAYLLFYFQMPLENVNIFRKDVQLSELVMRTLVLVQQKFNQDEQKFDEESAPDESATDEDYVVNDDDDDDDDDDDNDDNDDDDDDDEDDEE